MSQPLPCSCGQGRLLFLSRDGNEAQHPSRKARARPGTQAPDTSPVTAGRMLGNKHQFQHCLPRQRRVATCSRPRRTSAISARPAALQARGQSRHCAHTCPSHTQFGGCSHSPGWAKTREGHRKGARLPQSTCPHTAAGPAPGPAPSLQCRSWLATRTVPASLLAEFWGPRSGDAEPLDLASPEHSGSTLTPCGSQPHTQSTP